MVFLAFVQKWESYFDADRSVVAFESFVVLVIVVVFGEARILSHQIHRGIQLLMLPASLKQLGCGELLSGLHRKADVKRPSGEVVAQPCVGAAGCARRAPGLLCAPAGDLAGAQREPVRGLLGR